MQTFRKCIENGRPSEKNVELLWQNYDLLRQELKSKNEVIKSFFDTQTTILKAVLKCTPQQYVAQDKEPPLASIKCCKPSQESREKDKEVNQFPGIDKEPESLDQQTM